MILDVAIRLLLAPILGVQAMNVRKRALHLPEASGARRGTLGAGPVLRLLIVGDSSAAGVGVQTQTAALAGQLSAKLATAFTVHWQLHAKTGATTASTCASLRESQPDPADIIVTALGVNDVTHAVPRPLWLRRQRDLRRLLLEQTGARQIYVTGIPPLGHFPLLPNPLRWLLGRTAHQFDHALAMELAREATATHVAQPTVLNAAHMAADGFHPGPEIYGEWANVMARRIISDWPLTRLKSAPRAS